jgi:hypothetical protein
MGRVPLRRFVSPHFPAPGSWANHPSLLGFCLTNVRPGGTRHAPDPSVWSQQTYSDATSICFGKSSPQISSTLPVMRRVWYECLGQGSMPGPYGCGGGRCQRCSLDSILATRAMAVYSEFGRCTGRPCRVAAVARNVTVSHASTETVAKMVGFATHEAYTDCVTKTLHTTAPIALLMRANDRAQRPATSATAHRRARNPLRARCGH